MLNMWPPVLRKCMRMMHDHRVHTEWQWPISGVHSIMMEKLALAGESGGGQTHPPFTLFAITYRYKVAVYAQAEPHSPYFMYSVCMTIKVVFFVCSLWLY